MNLFSFLMIHFTPGPSQLSEQMNWFIHEAVDLEIPSVSHRSSYFSEFSKSAREWLRAFLQIPDNYKIFYTYSATECMEVIIRSTVLEHSHHFVNGAFSRRFYDTALDLGKKPTLETCEIGEWNYSLEVPEQTELIWVTCTETSTGVMLRKWFLKDLRFKYPDKLIAVDITSSWGGISHNFLEADVWFFSLQKCFWLPSGMAILVMNEISIEKSNRVFAQTHDIGSVHSLHHLLLRRQDYQTSETPNVLGIYLLSRQMQYFNSLGGISYIEQETLKKYEFMNQKIESLRQTYQFVKDEQFRAKTLWVIGMNPAKIDATMAVLKGQWILPGSWYWPLAFSTIRIANFPAHKMQDLEKLFYYLEKI